MMTALFTIALPPDRMTAPLAVSTVLGALVYIGVFSRIPEPSRRRASIVLLASGASLYYDGALGGWDKLFWLVIMGFAFGAFRWYPSLAIGWLVHTTWDLLSFHAGQALEGNTLRINLHCAIFDPTIALWFAFGAPSIWTLLTRRAPVVLRNAP
jgi:Family of unknown function (DUF6010)